MSQGVSSDDQDSKAAPGNEPYATKRFPSFTRRRTLLFK